MKHWYRTLTAKIICFILCILTLIITVAGVFGAVVLVGANFYTTTEQNIIEDTKYDLLYSDVYDIVYRALSTNEYTKQSLELDYAEDNTNIRFKLVSINDETVFTNGYKEDEATRVYDFYCNAVIYENGERDIDIIQGHSMDTVNYILKVYLEEGLPVSDEFAFVEDIIGLGFALKYWVYAIIALSFGLCITFFIILMCASGRRPHSDAVHMGVLGRVPIDILIASSVLILTFGLYLVLDVFYTGEIAEVIMLIVWGFLAADFALGLCMSISARIKQKTIFKNTLIWIVLKLIFRFLGWLWRGFVRLLKLIWKLIRNIPLVWKTALIVTVNFAVDVMLIAIASDWWYTEPAVVLYIIKGIVVGVGIIYISITMRQLQKGGDAIAKGDLAYRVDTKYMLWDFKRHGENLNSISDGMTTAVDQRLQSERTKTELITNVSHDIKTPLTSIINYGNLISGESDPDKCKEYSAVLVRKSEHLKRLLDDLVEISKATTGNLEVSLMPCDAGVLLDQAAGEFEERCKTANLELVTSLPDHNIRIMADSRRIWRVFENLMNNACKYSLTGSRVYLTLTKIDGEAHFIFRNTSRSALNISPDELMERFVRGDSSRSTEGNGLGLSIARSLTELQNGKMDITIDGDLFKVTLRFPMV